MLLDLLWITYGVDDTDVKYATPSVYDTATNTNSIGDYEPAAFSSDYTDTEMLDRYETASTDDDYFAGLLEGTLPC